MDKEETSKNNINDVEGITTSDERQLSVKHLSHHQATFHTHP